MRSLADIRAQGGTFQAASALAMLVLVALVFVVLLAEGDREVTEAVAERMRCAVEAIAVDCDGRVFRCAASFAVTALRADDADLDAMLERSDRALYEAESAGRNRIAFVDV